MSLTQKVHQLLTDMITECQLVNCAQRGNSAELNAVRIYFISFKPQSELYSRQTGGIQKYFQRLLFTLKTHLLFKFLSSIKSIRALCAISLQRLSKNIRNLSSYVNDNDKEVAKR